MIVFGQIRKSWKIKLYKKYSQNYHKVNLIWTKRDLLVKDPK